MFNIKENFTPPLRAVWWTSKALFRLGLILFSFWLMNQPDTIMLICGILLLVATITYVINIYYIKIKNKLKS